MCQTKELKIFAKCEANETANVVVKTLPGGARKAHFAPKATRIIVRQSDCTRARNDLDQIIAEIAKGVGQAIARVDHAVH